MDLGPKSPNNVFVDDGLENWVLVNQTNLKMDSDVERMKKKWFVLEQIILGKIQGGPFFYIILKFS